jgi:TolB-like protein
MNASGKNVVIGILSFGCVLATIAYFGKPVVRLKPQSPAARPSLAVLPFDNLDGADALELVAANVTVALTDELASMELFEVTPRAEVLQYKGLTGGAEKIAEALGVDYVLAGSVERSAGRLRLQAYVVMPGDRPRIWADEFFYDETDAERIPDDLAAVIRNALADPETTERN